MKLRFFAMASAIALSAALPADAAILIGVSFDNGATITQVASDSGTPGTANYNTTTGGFFYNVSATGSPILSQPNLLTQSINIKNTNGQGATLSVFITQTGLSSFTGALTSAFTSNAPVNSTSVISSYYSATNALFGGTLLQSTSFPAANTSSGTNAISLSGPFSTTLRYDIAFANGNGGNFNGTANLTAAVPEAATWALMVVGFGCIGFALRQRREARVTYA